MMLLLSYGHRAYALMVQVQENRIEIFILTGCDILTEQNFHGIQVRRTFNHTLPENWSVPADATQSIRFSLSPALKPISSMGDHWNDNLVGSTLLTEKAQQNS